ncbi:MAG TPA: alpha/beta hydrolase [Prosthecobacter sp.]
MKHLPLLLTLAFSPVTLLPAVDTPAAEGSRAGAGKARAAATPGKPYVYKTSAGEPRHMEIYFPPGHNAATAKVPGLILFHGGGWTGGSLSQFRTACAYFASRGLVCATVDYQMLSKADVKKRPAGESHKRVCITDAKSAIRWFKQKAPELGLDPQRIITGGGSAGGHISALATLNPGLNDPADAADMDTRVVAYLWFNPAFTADDQADPEVNVLPFLKADLAPAIAFFGTKDPWKKGWDTVQQRVKSLGSSSTELWLAEGQSHSFFNKGPWQRATLIAADRFLVKHGLLSGEPALLAPESGEKLVPGNP